MKYIAMDEALNAFPIHWVPILGLFIFITIFLIATFLVYRPKSKKQFAAFAHIVLDDGEKHESRK